MINIVDIVLMSMSFILDISWSWCVNQLASAILLHHFVPLMGILKKQVVLAAKCMFHKLSLGWVPFHKTKLQYWEKESYKCLFH